MEPGIPGAYSHYALCETSSANFVSTLTPEIVNGVNYGWTVHVECDTTDNQGVYPGTAVPAHMVFDGNYALSYHSGGGRGGGWHAVITWGTALITLTE